MEKTNIDSGKSEGTGARQNAIRWYNDPELIPVAREHDTHLEPRYAKFIAERIRQFDLANPRIIDIGCGEGLLSGMLKSPKEYIGIDPGRSSLNQTQSGSQGEVHFVKAGVENIPESISAADIIVSSLNIALWDDPLRRCAGLKELLKPGGRILIIDLLRKGPRIHRHPEDCLDRFLLDQFNASLSMTDVRNICEELLPGAKYTLFTDDRTEIMPSAGSTADYGNVFLITYEKKSQ